jgi:LacI family transcriptional regulator
MADVAARAGVSISTVSHVLNQTRPVSEELTGKVRQAIDDSGYSPNAVARSLATSSTKLIGVVMSAASNPFFGPLFSAVEETARRHGYNLLLTDSHDNVKLEERQIRVMLDHQIAGMILAPADTESSPALDMLQSRNLPVTLVDRFADDRFDQVGTENVAATTELVTHLAALGHQRIGFLKGRGGLSTTTERFAGYQAGLEAAGLRFDRSLVRNGRSLSPPAREATRALLSLPEPPTALVSGNNEMTLGMLRALRDVGLHIPDDIAVVGYDDVEWADLVQPGLTVTAQQIDVIGHTAVDLLLARMKKPGAPPRYRYIDASFVHRASCGCPEGASPITPPLSVSA